MEILFEKKDKFVKVYHTEIISRLLSWVLEQGIMGNKIWEIMKVNLKLISVLDR
jgi:hypothetical protein